MANNPTKPADESVIISTALFGRPVVDTGVRYYERLSHYRDDINPGRPGGVISFTDNQLGPGMLLGIVGPYSGEGPRYDLCGVGPVVHSWTWRPESDTHRYQDDGTDNWLPLVTFPPVPASHSSWYSHQFLTLAVHGVCSWGTPGYDALWPLQFWAGTVPPDNANPAGHMSACPGPFGPVGNGDGPSTGWGRGCAKAPVAVDPVAGAYTVWWRYELGEPAPNGAGAFLRGGRSSVTLSIRDAWEA